MLGAAEVQLVTCRIPTPGSSRLLPRRGFAQLVWKIIPDRLNSLVRLVVATVPP
jgi:hypothetical protein